MRWLLYTICVISAVLPCPALAAPQPAIVPAAGNWTVDVTFENPQQITIRRSGSHAKPERFWYVILTMTNKTDHDVEFYPNCELMTDTFHVLSAVKAASPALIEKIKERHQKIYPLLETLETVGNRILEGEDNAKEVVVIFKDFDAGAKSLKIFIAGLSNETVGVEHPVNKGANGQPLMVYLRKTLELGYMVGGDPAFRADQKLNLESKRWVMR